MHGDTPPPEFPIVKENYPAPTWIGVPRDDPRLFAIVLPIPEPLNKDATEMANSTVPVQPTEANASIEDRKPIMWAPNPGLSKTKWLANDYLARERRRTLLKPVRI